MTFGILAWTTSCPGEETVSLIVNPPASFTFSISQEVFGLKPLILPPPDYLLLILIPTDERLEFNACENYLGRVCQMQVPKAETSRNVYLKPQMIPR